MAIRLLIDGDEFVDLTGADISNIQWQNTGRGSVRVVRSDSKPAADTLDAWQYEPHEGERGTLEKLYPAGEGSRLWFQSFTGTSIRYVFS